MKSQELRYEGASSKKMKTKTYSLPLTPLLQLVNFSRSTEGPPTLGAYDCDDPRELRDVTNTGTENCQQLTTINHQENATYQILQTSYITRTTGYICRMVQTRTPNYPGTYDHQTMLPLLKQMRSPSLCPLMYADG